MRLRRRCWLRPESVDHAERGRTSRTPSTRRDAVLPKPAAAVPLAPLLPVSQILWAVGDSNLEPDRQLDVLSTEQVDNRVRVANARW
jgi:hypothetical protein